MQEPPNKKVTPNFLTCPAFPELEAPDGSASGEPFGGVYPERNRGTQGRLQAEAPKESASPLAKVIPPVSQRQPPIAHRLPKRRSTAFWITLLILLVLAATTGPALVALARAGIAAQAAKSALTRAVSQVEKRDFAQAGDELATAQSKLRDARDALRGVGFWRDVPTVGTQVRAMEDAASAGVSTLDGVGDLLKVASGLFEAAAQGGAVTGELGAGVGAERTYQDLTPEEKRAILARLDRALPDIRAAQAKISVALDTWNRVPQDKLFAPLRSALQPVALMLPRLKQSLDEALPLLETFIPLAGYPAPADYVVVLQNSDELRATGGFLGTVGSLQVDGGDLKRFVFDDVYNLDNPASGRWKETPPDPLRRYLGVQNWFFRDANWSPDFPSSAAKLLDFYRRELELATGQAVEVPDGVIALNPPFFKDLMRITGPIKVDEFTFDQDNFFDLLQYESEIGFLREGKIPVSRRKDIVVKLGDALLDKLTSLPAARWPELLDAATRALERKQIQIYARHPAELARLDARGWTGRAKGTSGDFLWVIDSNLAALKTDGVMTKRAAYSLDARDPSRPVATVTLRYTNNARDLGVSEYRYTRYRDYVRLYVPEGSELIEVKGAMKDDRYRTGGRAAAGQVDVFKDLGKTVFAAFWSIEPQTTQEIVFTYALPASVGGQVNAKAYRLDWPKQSGNDRVELTLDLEFGKKLQRAIPGEEAEHFGDSKYQVTADSVTDQTFEMTF